MAREKTNQSGGAATRAKKRSKSSIHLFGHGIKLWRPIHRSTGKICRVVRYLAAIVQSSGGPQPFGPCHWLHDWSRSRKTPLYVSPCYWPNVLSLGLCFRHSLTLSRRLLGQNSSSVCHSNGAPLCIKDGGG